MLLRRLLHPSRHLRHSFQTLTSTTAAGSSSSPLSAPLPFRRLPAYLLSPRLLSTSGRDDGTKKPWAFTPESSDPDPFADEDAAAAEAPLGSAAAVEDPWAKGFRADDSEKVDVFDEIYKNEATAAPAAGGRAPTGEREPWTLGREDEKYDPFAAAATVAGEAAPLGEDKPWTLRGEDEEYDLLAIAEMDEGAGVVDGGIDESGAGEGDVKELTEQELQEIRAREQQLMETIKGPNRAFGDLIAASGITEDMIDSLILLKDVRGVKGLPPLSEIQDRAIQKMNARSSRADVERQKQEEIAKARVREVDEKGRAYGTGKRKCSIARVWIQPGDGKFVVNDKQFDAYFPILDHRADLLRPFTVTKTLGLWDVNCTVKGGGVSGQVGAIRLGISRALQNWEPGLRPYLKAAGYMTRDPRVVERKKPGKAKARKSFQWVKR